VNGGSAEGVALVTRQGWAAFMAVDVHTGQVTERGHELAGLSVSDTILVIPRAKGSSAFSMGAQALRLAGTAPRALVIKEINPQSALGALVMRIPAVCDMDADPTEVIETGDWVRVDADAGTVDVIKKRFVNEENVWRSIGGD
jgi:predicted aconitase with swiveling domain